MNRKVKRLIIPAAAAAILGTSGFAYMATNTVAPSFAGSGNGSISGYHVTNLAYTTDNQQNYITSVSFDLNHYANPANVKAVTHDGTAADDRVYGGQNPCTETGNSNGTFHYACGPETPNAYANVATVNSITVNAAQ